MDLNGHSIGILDSILDFKKDDKALRGDNLYITTKTGRCRIRERTSGWLSPELGRPFGNKHQVRILANSL